MPLIIDRTQLPLLQLRYLGPFSDDELEAFLSELDGVLQLPGRKVCVIDLTHADPGSARQRQLQAAWIIRNEQELARQFAAAAIVTDRAIIRGTVTAVFWIRPLPFPTRVVATVESADAWLAQYRAELTR
ncbi:MAG TPA: STAS/SEC14 domain-containing protein [Polyangiales bacterium]|nr:STAS/SEC14 domain-containing protein [Polyangiales bacterium]